MTTEQLSPETSEPLYFRYPDLPVCSVNMPAGGWVVWDWMGTSNCWHDKTDAERDAIKEAERQAFSGSDLEKEK